MEWETDPRPAATERMSVGFPTTQGLDASGV